MQITLEDAVKIFEGAHGPLHRFDHNIARAYTTDDGTWFFISRAGVITTCKQPEVDTLTDHVNPNSFREDQALLDARAQGPFPPVRNGDTKD